MSNPFRTGVSRTNQYVRRLFYRTQLFWPSTILHNFAVLSRFGQLTDRVLKSQRALPSGEEEDEPKRPRGITSIHVYRQPFTGSIANHGTIVFSDVQLAQAFSQRTGEKEVIPLPTHQSAKNDPKYVDSGRIQYAGLKDVAPLIGLKLSNNERLLYNTDLTLDPSEKEHKEAQKRITEFLPEEDADDAPPPFAFAEIGMKEVAPPSRKYSDVRFPRAVEAFKQWKGFAHVAQPEADRQRIASDTQRANQPDIGIEQTRMEQSSLKESRTNHAQSSMGHAVSSTSSGDSSADTADSSTSSAESSAAPTQNSTSDAENTNVETDDKAASEVEASVNAASGSNGSQSSPAATTKDDVKETEGKEDSK